MKNMKRALSAEIKNILVLNNWFVSNVKYHQFKIFMNKKL